MPPQKLSQSGRKLKAAREVQEAKRFKKPEKFIEAGESRFGGPTVGKKPVVWYVDDLPENLEKFRQNHATAFTVCTFETPGQVLEALYPNRSRTHCSAIYFSIKMSQPREM